MMFFNPFESGLASNSASAFLFTGTANDASKAAAAVGGGGDHQLWSQLAASVVSAANVVNPSDPYGFVTAPNLTKHFSDATVMLPQPDGIMPISDIHDVVSAFTPCDGSSGATINLFSQFVAHRNHDALYATAAGAIDVKPPTAALSPKMEQNVKPSRKHPPTSACLGCNEAINDKIFIHIGESSWHDHCVRCAVCAQLLDNHPSCFTRDGLLYCRQDYFRKFSRHCERCGDVISAGEMVIHASPSHTFHLSCFTCVICGWSLSTGETYFLGQSGSLICQRHYNGIEKENCGEKLADKKNDDSRYSGSEDGRIEVPSAITRNDSAGYINHTASTTPTTSFGVDLDDELSSADSSGAAGHSHGNKAKRMRTSFKHQQLRMMKGYFTINHNPDAKDLKQLAVKTGLSKRVLQVWFQNARAKYRRSQQNHRIDPMLPRCGGANGGSGDDSPASCITYAMELQMMSNPVDINGFRYGSASISGRTSISPTDSTTIFEVLADDDSASSAGGVISGVSNSGDCVLRPQFLTSQSQTTGNDVNIVML